MDREEKVHPSQKWISSERKLKNNVSSTALMEEKETKRDLVMASLKKRTDRLGV